MAHKITGKITDQEPGRTTYNRREILSVGVMDRRGGDYKFMVMSYPQWNGNGRLHTTTLYLSPSEDLIKIK